MRSPVVTDRVLAQKDSRLQNLLTAHGDNAKVVEELFLGTLARYPQTQEKQIAVAALDKDRVNGAQNLQWALLNLAEFLYNY